MKISAYFFPAVGSVYYVERGGTPDPQNYSREYVRARVGGGLTTLRFENTIIKSVSRNPVLQFLG